MLSQILRMRTNGEMPLVIVRDTNKLRKEKKKNRQKINNSVEVYKQNAAGNVTTLQ